jgi:hypothetical protein
MEKEMEDDEEIVEETKIEVDYTAANLKKMAEEFNSNLESKETAQYFRRIMAAASGGALHIDIKDDLTEDQIKKFTGQGYGVCKIVQGKPPTYRICWD